MTILTEVKVPYSGTVENVEFIEWYVGIGDVVTEGQPLAEVSTDKVDTELESPAAGRLVKILVEAETEVPVGTVAAVLVDEGVSDSDAQAALENYEPSAPE